MSSRPIPATVLMLVPASSHRASCRSALSASTVSRRQERLLRQERSHGGRQQRCCLPDLGPRLRPAAQPAFGCGQGLRSRAGHLLGGHHRGDGPAWSASMRPAVRAFPPPASHWSGVRGQSDIELFECLLDQWILASVQARSRISSTVWLGAWSRCRARAQGGVSRCAGRCREGRWSTGCRHSCPGLLRGRRQPRAAGRAPRRAGDGAGSAGPSQ